jgi:broad specificity phosphatase PhoE
LQVDQIFSSPILRAMQTAQILSESLRIQVETTEALREWSVGIYEGTRDPHGWELHHQVWEDWSLGQKFDSKMPGGESLNEIQARFTPFIDGLLKERENSPKTIFLVGHGGLFSAMLPIIFKNVDFAFAREHYFPNTGYVLAEKRPDGLNCLSWCGTPIIS